MESEAFCRHHSNCVASRRKITTKNGRYSEDIHQNLRRLHNWKAEDVCVELGSASVISAKRFGLRVTEEVGGCIHFHHENNGRGRTNVSTVTTGRGVTRKRRNNVSRQDFEMFNVVMGRRRSEVANWGESDLRHAAGSIVIQSSIRFYVD